MKTRLLILTAFVTLCGSLTAQTGQVLHNYEGTGPKDTMNIISCTVAIVANPSKTGINTSDSVVMLSMAANHDEWAGFWVTRRTGDDADSSTAWIDANMYRYVHVMVYKDRVSNLKFKLEGSYTGTVEKYATNPVNGTNAGMNVWEDIVIDFNEVAGFVPIWLVSPNWDDPERTTASSVIYVDNIVINNDAEPYTSGGATGIKNQLENAFTLFPNPVQDELHLENVSGSDIIITNSLGEQIRHFKSTSDEIVLPVNDLAAGIYFVIVTDNSGKTESHKLIKN